MLLSLDPTVKNKVKEEDGSHSVGSRKQNLDHDRSLSMDDKSESS